jgi:hypothetical protein
LTLVFRYCSAVSRILASTIDDNSSADWSGTSERESPRAENEKRLRIVSVGRRTRPQPQGGRHSSPQP